MAEEDERSKDEVEFWSWGAGTDGQLATAQSQDEDRPCLITCLSRLQISSIACGGAHALALVQGGNVFAWGRGKSGQLGNGTFETSLQPVKLSSLENVPISNIAAGWNHSAFVSESGDIFTCGDGAFGQLGHGNYDKQCRPIKVEAFAAKPVLMASCGMRHTLVLLKGRASFVFSFGSNRHGQLGFRANEQSNLFSSIKKGRFNVPIQIELDIDNVAFVCASGEHSAALTDTGRLYVWGKGFSGASDIHIPMLLRGSLKFCQIALGWNHGITLTEHGEVYMWGGSSCGSVVLKGECIKESNLMPSGEDSDCIDLKRVDSFEGIRIKEIAAGAEHFAAVTDNEILMTWGWGEHGQLGLGNAHDQQDPQVVSFHDSRISASVILKTYCGSGFTFLVKQFRHLA